MAEINPHQCGDAACKEQHKEITIFDAAKSGVVDAVKHFVGQTGVEVLKQQDEKGHTAAHWAALGGHTNVLRYIIETKGPFDEASSNTLKQHPIHWACVNGHIAAVDLLVQAGVSMDTPDGKGCTPLIVAAQYGKVQLSGYLMGKGANMQLMDRDGDTALHWAAFKGFSELIRLLVYSGFNSHQADKYGQTPLHLACINGDLNSVKELVERDKVEISLKDKNGKTPLMLAQGRKHHTVIQYLGGRSSLRTKFLEKVDLWSLIFGAPGQNRFPMLVYAFSVLVLGYPLYVIKAVPLTWYLMPNVHYAFLGLNVIMWVSFYLANKADPGFLPRNQPEYDQGIKQVAHFDEWKQGMNPLSRLCHTCRSVKTKRSKHCRICNRCIRQMDHHCPYIHNCVGVNNRIHFVVFTMCVFLLGLLTLKLGLTVWELEQWRFSLLYWLGLIELVVFECMSTLVAGMSILNILGNLTTNERVNWKRYKYLKDASGRYRNLYSRGWKANVLEFCHLKRMLTEEELEFLDVKVV